MVTLHFYVGEKEMVEMLVQKKIVFVWLQLLLSVNSWRYVAVGVEKR